ncbi:MIP18 family protein [Nakaseomyces glabratus]|uniref:MIP18 family protein n=1 Tax=Candida glabrata TaxID=5478 RepID=A0A0W0DAF7_CANGB|nr:Iron-sulfur cluster assembly protein [Nakaseomyces glabratus]KAH7581836.1 Iron-sulfur cluster assembly protein [Nakaseomyces glabratus]KAH7581988.1 Iron-sulfur cluster assembly protein [Nakaseomyces glabratus]KAH7594293.1 Iron-sulfur cluster assembly protein [Nakaseomyces glabratus]KAH7611481.1 Iron-sulfur cluster assembly protein [Nakaseomyces glabratus]
MSEYINENPDVLDESDLPKRAEDASNQLLLNGISNKTTLERKKLLLQIENSTDSSLQKNIELFDKLLSLNQVPDLVSDSGDDCISNEEDGEDYDPVDEQEIYDLIAYIQDPEHPLTLAQLSIVNLQDIKVVDSGNPADIAEVLIKITPTITHCSLATLIGLGIRVRLERSLPPRFRITIMVKEGTHNSENQVNKQLNDKERVAAACENEQLLSVVSKMLLTCK